MSRNFIASLCQDQIITRLSFSARVFYGISFAGQLNFTRVYQMVDYNLFTFIEMLVCTRIDVPFSVSLGMGFRAKQAMYLEMFIQRY